MQAYYSVRQVHPLVTMHCAVTLLGSCHEQTFWILGKMDGMNWQELYRREVDIDVTQPVRLKVSVHGDRISVGLNGQEGFHFHDSTYKSGSIGFRVVDADATFSNLSVH